MDGLCRAARAQGQQRRLNVLGGRVIAKPAHRLFEPVEMKMLATRALRRHDPEIGIVEQARQELIVHTAAGRPFAAGIVMLAALPA